MNVKLFELALERLTSGDWSHFEKLSSNFLISELPSLRTMASPSGDGGRDSELFSPDANPSVAVQYSVSKNWKTKIRNTVKRLQECHTNIKILIYMSNQEIGGKADELKGEILTKGIMLDVRDRNWFLERALTDATRENAAEQLIDSIARPYLAGESVIDKPSSPLTSGEAKAALLYLGLQWQDDITDKSLTKLSFDALVRAALRHTNSDDRMSRQQIYDAVSAALPTAERSVIELQTDKALRRLTKRFIRHWEKNDEFCLTYDEHQRILGRLADKETEEAKFYSTVEEHCVQHLKEIDDNLSEDVIGDLRTRVVRVLEQLLLRRGEAFVEAVITETVRCIGISDMMDLIFEDISSNPTELSITEHLPTLIATIIQSMLSEPLDSTYIYLRRLANSYTLLSFLNQTPDAQSATRKLFSYGKIWIDTTVLLPLFAEQLEENEEARRLTKTFSACVEAGIELRVTTGIIQEVNAHMNNALMCSKYQPGTWKGRTPYLYYQYLRTGQAPQAFPKWLSLFRGNERQDEDILQYLGDTFGVKLQDLDEAASKINNELRWALDRLWAEAHTKRRKHTQQVDNETTRILIAHDIETYLGVIALRREETISELGYRHWLLTLDQNAWAIRDTLREEFKSDIPPSPLLSLSFLLNNMTFGPSRSKADTNVKLKLPIFLDLEMSETFPQDIIEIANKVRQENEGLPEYVIRRKVRDAIDKARRRHGLVDPTGIFDHEETEQGAALNRYSAALHSGQ